MSFRALLALGLLVLAVSAERCGYYAVRAFLTHDFMRDGLSSMQTLTVLRALTFVTYVAPFVGGGLAYKLGPRTTAIVGAVIAAVGAFAMAAGAPASKLCFVVALGAGIFRPTPIAAAAEVLMREDGGPSFTPSPRNLAAVATFASIAYAAVNLGSMIAPTLAGLLRDTRDGSGGAAYGVAGALDVLAAMLAGGALFLGSDAAKAAAQQAHAPYRMPDPTQGAPNANPHGPTRPPEAVFGPLVLLGGLYACTYFVMERATPNPVELGLARAAWIFSVNPVVVLVMSVPCAVLYLVFAVQRSPVALTRIIGAGALVFAFGGALGMLALLTHAGLALWFPSLGAMAVGEALIFPLGLAYAALALRSRASTLVVAGWSSLTAMPAFMLGLSTSDYRGSLLGTGVALLAVVAIGFGGVLVLAKAQRLHEDLVAR